MKPAGFGYAAPHELGEALGLLESYGYDAKALAGGQSLLPMVNLRLARPAVLVDINRVAALSGIARRPGELRIAGGTRQIEVERSAATELPLLGMAIAKVGHVATRGRGTIGGSIAHADPAAELPAVLCALDGEVVATSSKGERTIAAADLFLSTFATTLAEDELLTEVRLPVREGARHGFVEFARRHGDFAICGAAAEVVLDADGKLARAALALLGVAEVPLRLPALEAELVGRRPADLDLAADVAAAVSREVDPAADVHASAAYRKRVSGVAAARAIAQALAGDAHHGG